MKYIFILFFYLFSSVSSFSSEKTAFLDIDLILNNSNLGKSIYSDLEKLNKKNLDDLEKKEKLLKEQKISIDKTKNVSSKEKFEKDVNLFNQEINKYRIEKDKKIKEFKIKKKKQLNEFLIKINPIIQDYMKNNSITIIFEKKQIFIGSTNIDITNDILELVNNKL